MASQSSYELPPEWGLMPPNPDPDLVLPGDAIGRDLDRIDMPSLNVPIGRIIGSTPLAFRPDVEVPDESAPCLQECQHSLQDSHIACH